MAATDDTFGHIQARVRARQKALGEALQAQSDAATGVVPVIDKKVRGLSRQVLRRHCR